MIKNGIAEKIFIGALPCETIVTDRAGKIIKANCDCCKARILPHDKKFFSRNKGHGIREKDFQFLIPNS